MNTMNRHKVGLIMGAFLGLWHLGWCLLVFLFFSAAGGKREVYLMPMLPLLAVAQLRFRQAAP